MAEKTEDRRKQAKLEEMSQLANSVSNRNPLYVMALIAFWLGARFYLGSGDALMGITGIITYVVTQLMGERSTTIGYYFGSSKKTKGD